jgi:hypothetical protein
VSFSYLQSSLQKSGCVHVNHIPLMSVVADPPVHSYNEGQMGNCDGSEAGHLIVSVGRSFLEI